MPISYITLQPSANSINAAYRPVYFLVGALATGLTINDPAPPVVYCDIYINGVYYKTLAKTQYYIKNSAAYDYQFDIRDACQEALLKFIAPAGGATVYQAFGLLISVQCRFRSSGLDVNGFTQTENTAPVQGTGGNPPVSGTGTATNTFYVVNAAIQHEEVKTLEVLLSSYKTGSWNMDAFPLTSRNNNYKVSTTDSDFFPFVNRTGKTFSTIRLHYVFFGQSTPRTADYVLPSPIVSQVSAYYLPNGPKNLQFLFPSIDFSELLEYYVELIASDNTVVMSTTKNTILLGCDDHLRLHFLNYYGAIDAITFNSAVKEHESKSDTFEKPVALQQIETVHGVGRFNIKANDLLTLKTADYGESDMRWIDELFDSPLSWIEGGPSGYLPVVIVDKKNQKKKEEDRYTYEISLEARMSHEKITLRN